MSGGNDMPAAYILKCRDFGFREHTDYRGVRRRVRYRKPWIGVLWGLSEERARQEVSERNSRGLTEWAAFYKGKRVIPAAKASGSEG